MFGNRGKRTVELLEERGKRANAVVLEVGRRGLAISHGSAAIITNTEVAVKVRLRVEPEDEPAFEIETKLRFGQMNMPSVDKRISVIYDPEDHETVMLDESITGSMDAFMGGKMTPEIKTMLEAGDAARAKGGSVKDMIAAVKSANPAAGAGPAVFIGGQPAAMGGQQAPPVDPIVRLERLAKLHAQGVLTDEEFQAQKTKLLAET